jgi:hypothetical protein
MRAVDWDYPDCLCAECRAARAERQIERTNKVYRRVGIALVVIVIVAGVWYVGSVSGM